MDGRTGPVRRTGSLLVTALLLLLGALLGGLTLRDAPGAARAGFGPVVGGRPAVAAGPGATAGAGRGPTSGPDAAGAPTGGSFDVAALAAAVSPGVVDVTATLAGDGARVAGTGIVVGADGLVLTNNHVVAGAAALSATEVVGGRTYRAEVLGYDRTGDVAVLRLAGAADLPTVTVGDPASVRTGDPVLGLGNAGGVGGAPSAAPGTVTALDRTITVTDERTGGTRDLGGLIQVAADIRPGDSGGPLVDAAGQVIGIDTAASVGMRYATLSGEGYAIPIDVAVRVLRDVLAGGGPDVHVGATASLGLSVVPARRQYGALVTGVDAGSPAARAGVGRGDIVTAVAGRAVEDPDTLAALLEGRHPGELVSLAWQDRWGTPYQAQVRLVAGPPA
jgi:S1-C subfamily serine protease